MPKRKAKRDQAPSWLGDVGAAEWARMKARLESLGMADQVEAAALETYARAYETFRRAEAVIERDGFRLKGEAGRPLGPVPELQVSNRAALQIRTFLNDSGLTPRTIERPLSEPVSEETIEQKRARIIRSIVA